jgi:hypothetical protein
VWRASCRTSDAQRQHRGGEAARVEASQAGGLTPCCSCSCSLTRSRPTHQLQRAAASAAGRRRHCRGGSIWNRGVGVGSCSIRRRVQDYMKEAREAASGSAGSNGGWRYGEACRAATRRRRERWAALEADPCSAMCSGQPSGRYNRFWPAQPEPGRLMSSGRDPARHGIKMGHAGLPGLS